MVIYNPRSVKEIQEERKLESSGNTKEQLAYVLKVQEANKGLTEQSVGDLSLALGEISKDFSQAMAELTMLIGAGMGGTN
jgi:hypothetical protein|nr:MAG TPA: hypothetical protein [Caudoviricetes sp.]